MSSMKNGTLRNFLTHPLTLYGLVTLAILFPLLLRGYVLTLDMVFAPHIAVPHHSDPHYILLGILHIANVLLPSDIIQKVVLGAIFMTAGGGMHYLMVHLRSIRIGSAPWTWACYFAGILYICNPFVYSRFMSGQYTVLLAYALLPIVGLMALRLATMPRKGTVLSLGIATGAVSMASLHMLIPAGIIACVFIGHGIWQKRSDKKQALRITLGTVLAILIALLANAYWLAPLARGHGETAATIASFTAGDQDAFQTTSGQFGLVGAILSLQGFWGDIQNIYDTPDTLFTLWFIPIVLLWLLVLGGVVWSWRNQRAIAVIFLITGFIATISAIGSSGTIFASLNSWLTANIPFAAGYREPQKFVALLAMSYAYFGAVSVAIMRQHAYYNTSYIAMVVPFFAAPLLLFGGMGQLRTVDYPKDWYVTDTELLGQVREDEKTLFLPWHLYMPYSFTERVIANPAPKFFSVPIVASSDPELGGASPSLQDETSRQVGKLLENAEKNEILAKDLSALHIRYIIVSKDFDYKKYDYLQRKKGISLYKQMETLILYRVTER